MEENKQQSEGSVGAGQTTESVSKEEPVIAEVQADPNDVEKNKGMAILAYFLFFIPMLTEAKDSKFAMFHANQSLILALVAIGIFVLGSIIAMVTFGFGGGLVLIAWLAWIVFWVMGIVNAANGKMKELPLIGGIHILDKK